MLTKQSMEAWYAPPPPQYYYGIFASDDVCQAAQILQIGQNFNYRMEAKDGSNGLRF